METHGNIMIASARSIEWRQSIYVKLLGMKGDCGGNLYEFWGNLASSYQELAKKGSCNSSHEKNI